MAPAQTGALTVVTSPPGAEVELEGEAGLVGVSPVTFGYLLVGEYRMTVSKLGYESYSTTLILDPSQPQQVNVKLTPKTTAKAVLRSFFIPGWGQKYAGRKTKSWFFGTLFIGSSIWLYIEYDDLDSKRDVYQARLERYDQAVDEGADISELNRRYLAMVVAQDRAHDASKDRDLAAAVTIGIWGLNVIDALLFSPAEQTTFSVKGLSVSPSVDQSSAGIKLSLAF